jgi:predicted component of type VI protein secretion system
VAALVDVRHHHAPAAALAILSNATTLGSRDVREGLAALDERYLKLDAGDDRMLRALNASPVPVGQLVRDFRGVPGFVIQAMFVSDPTGRLDNTRPAQVAAWLEAVGAIRPLAVQLYSVDRSPAWPGLRPVGAERLEEIAGLVRKLGVAAEVF